MTIRDQLLAQKGEKRFANRIGEKRISEILRVRLRGKKREGNQVARESSSIKGILKSASSRETES